MAVPEGYIDSYLLPCAAYGWQGGPEFKTATVAMRNGRERRNGDWAEAHHSFSVPFLNINKENYLLIKQGHLLARGALFNFKFRDELDYEAIEEIFGEGDGVETTFQLRKVSAIEGVSYTRNTYVVADTPADPTPVILVNGLPETHTIDYDRGLVTFSSAPANGAVLEGTWNFALWVHFGQDNLPFSIDNKNARNGVVSLIEVPPPEAA